MCHRERKCGLSNYGMHSSCYYNRFFSEPNNFPCYAIIILFVTKTATWRVNLPATRVCRSLAATQESTFEQSWSSENTRYMKYAGKNSFTKSNVCGNPMPNTFAPQKSTFWAATSSHYRVALSDLEESCSTNLVSNSFPAKLKYKRILCLTFFANQMKP